MNYLLVGHTHEIIDQVFSRYSVALRKENCLTLSELMEVAKVCYNPRPTAEHVQSVTDWQDWFISNDMMNRSVCDMTFNHAFRIKAFDVPGENLEPTRQILIHSKKLGYRPNKNEPKAWRPSGGVQCWYGVPTDMRLVEPVAQRIRPMELGDFEDLRKIVHGLERFLGNKFTGDMKAFWEHVKSFQESVMEGNDGATDFQFFTLSPYRDSGE